MKTKYQKNNILGDYYSETIKEFEDYTNNLNVCLKLYSKIAHKIIELNNIFYNTNKEFKKDSNLEKLLKKEERFLCFGLNLSNQQKLLKNKIISIERNYNLAVSI